MKGPNGNRPTAEGAETWRHPGQNRDFLEPHYRLKRKIKARSNLCLRRVASFAGFFRLENESDIRRELGIGIHLREKLKCLCADEAAGQQASAYQEDNCL